MKDNLEEDSTQAKDLSLEKDEATTTREEIPSKKVDFKPPLFLLMFLMCLFLVGSQFPRRRNMRRRVWIPSNMRRRFWIPSMSKSKFHSQMPSNKCLGMQNS